MAYALFAGSQNRALQALVVGMGSYLLGETFRSYRLMRQKEALKTVGEVVHIDWVKTYEQWAKECMQTMNPKACSQMAAAKARVQRDGKPVPPPPPPNPCAEIRCPKGSLGEKVKGKCKCVKKTAQVSAPQSSIAVRNAKKACSEGDNAACCWLKKAKKMRPPKPCKESAAPAPSVSGLGNYV